MIVNQEKRIYIQYALFKKKSVKYSFQVVKSLCLWNTQLWVFLPPLSRENKLQFCVFVPNRRSKRQGCGTVGIDLSLGGILKVNSNQWFITVVYDCSGNAAANALSVVIA